MLCRAPTTERFIAAGLPVLHRAAVEASSSNPWVVLSLHLALIARLLGFVDARGANLSAELAPLTQGSFVVLAVAQALGVRESPNRPSLEMLLAHLRQKPLLLILDNCEHVIAEASALADTLLGRCPLLRILTTSREPLRISGERTYRLPS
jgi:predicted ATPase